MGRLVPKPEMSQASKDPHVCPGIVNSKDNVNWKCEWPLSHTAGWEVCAVEKNGATRYEEERE